jgi:hypothetical protein
MCPAAAAAPPVAVVVAQGCMVPPSYFRPVEVDDAAADGLLTTLKYGLAPLPLPSDWMPAQRLLHHRGILTCLALVAASTSAGRSVRHDSKAANNLSIYLLTYGTYIPTYLSTYLPTTHCTVRSP